MFSSHSIQLIRAFDFVNFFFFYSLFTNEMPFTDRWIFFFFFISFRLTTSHFPNEFESILVIVKTIFLWTKTNHKRRPEMKQEKKSIFIDLSIFYILWHFYVPNTFSSVNWIACSNKCVRLMLKWKMTRISFQQNCLHCWCQRENLFIYEKRLTFTRKKKFNYRQNAGNKQIDQRISTLFFEIGKMR